MAKSDFLRIETPRGTLLHCKTGNGSVSVRLAWSADFGARRTQCFASAQMAVDSEVLRYSSAYIPKVTGMLDASGRLGTVIGTGNVRYIAPYAKAQYYNTATTRRYDPQRGAKWFERMKLRHKDAILRVAKSKAGGK